MGMKAPHSKPTPRASNSRVRSGGGRSRARTSTRGYEARTIALAAARCAVVTDSDNRIVCWNRLAAELFERTSEQVAGRNLQQVVDMKDIFGNRLSTGHSALHEIVREGEAPESFELDVRTASGQRLRVAVSIVVVLGPEPGRYELVYLLTPLRRRRRADEAIDRLLAQTNLPGVTVPGAPLPTGAEQRGTSKQPHLTRRQLEVLLLLAEGKRSGEIAEELNISVHTVRTHIQGILRTLGAANRLEAVSRALHERII
jgi:DNA-binding CsgD family transcriptional regulator